MTNSIPVPVFPEHRPREWNQGADMLSKRDTSGFLRLAAWYEVATVTLVPVPSRWRDTWKGTTVSRVDGAATPITDGDEWPPFR